MANPTARLAALLSQLCHNVPQGSVVVASLDVLLDLGNNGDVVDGARRAGACVSLLVVCCYACRSVPSNSHPVPYLVHSTVPTAYFWIKDR